MKQLWHVARPELRSDILKALRTEQSDLHLSESEGAVVVSGSFVLRDAQGEIDRFAIRITFPHDFPDSLPIVEEIGGRIPRTSDRHVNPNGSACLLVPEEWFALAEDQSFSAFLRGPVHNFFVGQALVESGKPWPFGERPHGSDGVVEAYEEILGLKGIDQLKSFLKVLARDRIKGHWPCPCASAKPLRNCHRDLVYALSAKIKPRLANQMLTRLGS